MPQQSTPTPTATNGPAPASAIVYCQVSAVTSRQKRRLQLAHAGRIVPALLRRARLHVLDVYHDAHSGTELDRPGLNATIDAVAALKPSVVVLHDVDRLGP